MRRTYCHPAAMLAFAAAGVLRHLPSLVRRTWWTSELIGELRAAEAAAADLEAFGCMVSALARHDLAGCIDEVGA